MAATKPTTSCARNVTARASQGRVGSSVMRHSPQGLRGQAVEHAGGPPEDVLLFTRARARGQALERVQADAIAIAALVDRKIAAEHAPARSEQVDARLDPRPPCVGEPCRIRRPVTGFKAEAAQPHAESA